MWSEFKAWIASKGGVLHTLVIVYLAALTWFSVSPAFHSLCVEAWAKFPSALQMGLEAVMQILALYGVGGGVKVAGKKLAAKLAKKTA